MSEAAPLLHLHGVERARGDGFVLRIEDFTVGDGDNLALVGPSGSGKSTCLDLMALTLRPDAADVMRVDVVNSVDAAALWRNDNRAGLAELRARHFGYVLQTGGLAPFLSLLDNALLSRRLLGLPGAGPIPDLAAQLGISHLMRRKPRQVSIGERQRAAVVRALAHEPAIVLADEPTASLDQSSAETVMRLLTAATEDIGAALVVVTHDPALAQAFGLELVTCSHDSETRQTIIARLPT